MAIFDYGIGGNEVNVDANESNCRYTFQQNFISTETY